MAWAREGMRVRELTIVTSPPELVDPLVDATPVIPASMRVLEEVEDCAFIFAIANPARTSKQSWLVIVASLVGRVACGMCDRHVRENRNNR